MIYKKSFREGGKMNNIERKPRYAMRKLSIGLVSCMLGFTLMAIPSQSFAAEGAESEPTQVEETHQEEPKEDSAKEGGSEDKGNKIDNNANNVQETLELGDEIKNNPVHQENEEENIVDLTFTWKYSSSSPETSSNPKLKGQELELGLFISYIDSNGQQVDYNYYGPKVKIKYGEDTTLRFDLGRFGKAINKDVANISDVQLLVNDYTKNYKISQSNSGFNRNSKSHRIVLQQDMDTSVQEKFDTNALILDKDKENFKVKYKIVQHKNTGEKDEKGNFKFEESGNVVENKQGKKLEYSRDFKNNSDIKLAWDNDDIKDAIYGSRTLSIFNEWQGKNNKFSIITEFDGKDAEKHKKYYNLTVEGDDINGWKVTLGSNLKEKEDIKERTTQKFTTKEIYDDTLDEGYRKIEQEGHDEIVKETFRLIYLPGKNDTVDEEVERTLKRSEKIQNLVKQIIRIGTKKKPNPSGPIIRPGDNTVPSNPSIDTPDEDDEEYRKLIEELIKEIKKETEKQDQVESPNDEKKQNPSKVENKTETPSETKKESTNPQRDAKKDQANPYRNKKADQRANKSASPKTGVTGSLAVAALGLSSFVASLGLRKKND